MEEENWFVEEKSTQPKTTTLFVAPVSAIIDNKVGLGCSSSDSFARSKNSKAASTTTKFSEDYALKKKLFGKWDKKNLPRYSSNTNRRATVTGKGGNAHLIHEEDSKAKMVGKSTVTKTKKVKKRIYSV